MHLRELEPTSWREDTVGTGSYGVVYRARWRGQRVAIKELKIPREPENTVHGAVLLHLRALLCCCWPIRVKF